MKPMTYDGTAVRTSNGGSVIRNAITPSAIPPQPIQPAGVTLPRAPSCGARRLPVIDCVPPLMLPPQRAATAPTAA